MSLVNLRARHKTDKSDEVYNFFSSNCRWWILKANLVSLHNKVSVIDLSLDLNLLT